jgi:hypothetical protein
MTLVYREMKLLLPERGGGGVTLPGDWGSGGMVPKLFWNLTTFFDIQFKNTSNLNFLDFKCHLKDFFTRISKQVLLSEICGFKKFKTDALKPCSHFYFDINFGDKLYSKEKRGAWPLVF